MFSLIIVTISILLVGGLALATLYYGGPAWNQASVKARTAQLLSEAAQVQGAVQLFAAVNHRLPTGPEELTANGEWLKNMPENWGGGPSSIITTPDSTVVQQDSCLLFNQKRLQINTIPFCNDPLYTNKVVCCQEPPVFVTP